MVKKKKLKKEAKVERPEVYKGHNIKWLKEVGKSFPMFFLVKEYEDIYGEV